jgi:hypothetical protein
MKAILIMIGFLLSAFVTTIGVQNMGDVQATEGCSEPEEYDETHLIERCDEGAYLIDKETGDKDWTGTANGLGKACDETETGMQFCMATP